MARRLRGQRSVPPSLAQPGTRPAWHPSCLTGSAGGLPSLRCRSDPPPSAGKSSSKRRSSDIISLLVSIYGSKDLFINEYRSLLADRLLHQLSFSPER